jgi:hypothetical protein
MDPIGSSFPIKFGFKETSSPWRKTGTGMEKFSPDGGGCGDAFAEKNPHCHLDTWDVGVDTPSTFLRHQAHRYQWQ